MVVNEGDAAAILAIVRRRLVHVDVPESLDFIHRNRVFECNTDKFVRFSAGESIEFMVVD